MYLLLPSGHDDHVKIPHVNLSITSYESDSLKTLVGMGSPSIRTQEISFDSTIGWTGVSSNERPYWKMNTGNF